MQAILKYQRGVECSAYNNLFSVEGIILARIDSFSPTAQLVLKVASVIGHFFTVEMLEAVYPVTTEPPVFIEILLQVIFA